MQTKAKSSFIALLATLALAAVALNAGPTSASSRAPSPAANPDTIARDLSSSQVARLRLGSPVSLTYRVTDGAQYVFGSSVGALTEQWSPTAIGQFSSLLNQPGAKRVTQWGPDTVFVFERNGYNVFVLDTYPHTELLLWLQGQDLSSTLSTLQGLYNAANAGTLP